MATAEKQVVSSKASEGGQESGAGRSDAGTRSRWRLPIMIGVFTAVALLVIRFFWNQLATVIHGNPSFGESVPRMISMSLVIHAYLVSVLWLVYRSPGRRWKWFLGGIGVPAVIAAACIRELKVSGDFIPNVVFRWDPTALELVTAANAKMGSAGAIESIPSVNVGDLLEYRGAKRDGVIEGPALNRDWDAKRPVEVWRRPMAGGYASMAVLGDLVVTMDQRGDNEVIVCLNAKNGAEHWTLEYPAKFDGPMSSPGPRSTPTIHEGKVYTMGAKGDVICCDLKTGKKEWNLNVLRKYGLSDNNWGMCSCPLVVDEKVILNVGPPSGNGVLAVEKSTGKVIWESTGLKNASGGQSHAGYSSPMVAELCGERILLNLDGEGLYGYEIATGKDLFSFAYTNGAKVNVAQPLVLPGDRVFLAASYDVGCRMLQISRKEGKWEAPKELWPKATYMNMECKFTSPVYRDGHIYGLDEGILVCLNAETGKSMWKKSRTAQYRHGQILLCGNDILVMSEEGELALVKAEPDQFTELTRMKVIGEGITWNPPAVARGVAYVRNEEELVCVDLNPPSEKVVTQK